MNCVSFIIKHDALRVGIVRMRKMHIVIYLIPWNHVTCPVCAEYRIR